MAVTTDVRQAINAILRPFNVRLDTWTAIDREQARIHALKMRGALDAPVYPVTVGMACFDPTPLADAYVRHHTELERLLDPARNDVGYTPENDYYRATDAAALYLLVRTLRPRRIVEIGCGNSTRISRQAIRDGALSTEIVAIDPSPRIDIAGMVDRFENCRLEDLKDLTLFKSLGAGDILFIDSSHEVVVGNDVATLFCRAIPALAPGVVVHVHDIFLPYDYPEAFAFHHPHWGEQYILHALLFGRDCEVLWPGFYLQRERPELLERLPFLTRSRAQSFWFRWK